MNQFDKFSKKELEYAVNTYKNWSEVLRCLGSINSHHKSCKTLKNKLDELNIYYGHLDDINVYRSKHLNKIDDSQVFTLNSDVSSATVRRHFKKIESIPYECSICGLGPLWNGLPLVLTMDHIDGNNRNNELSNLRWVCPNCDRQLPTYSGRNKIYLKKRSHKSRYFICPRCGRKKDYKSKYCLDCHNQLRELHIQTTGEVRPSREILKDEIRTQSFISLGKKYNVSDRAVSKWCKMMNLPDKKSEIKKYSDEEWKKL